MPPVCAIPYFLDSGILYVIQRSDLDTRHFSLKRPDMQNVFWKKLCFPMFLAKKPGFWMCIFPVQLAVRLIIWLGTTAVSLSSGLTTFAYHVCHIVCVCTKKQMIRTYARSRVAIMADMYKIWDRAVGEKPAEAVCHHALARSPGESPIATRHNFALPQPATTLLEDKMPETLNMQRGQCGKIWASHTRLPYSREVVRGRPVRKHWSTSIILLFAFLLY